MMKILITLFFFLMFVSCKDDSINKQTHLIKEDTMVDMDIDSLFFVNVSETVWDSLGKYRIPVDLDDCLNQLDKLISDTLKITILEMEEHEFFMENQFGTGLWIRNNWILRENSRLEQYFIQKGINNPDYMSSIILKSYYQRLISKNKVEK